MHGLDLSSLALLAVVIAMILVAFEMNESLRPQYRKGCRECDDAKRHAEQVQRDLQHDYAHEHGLPCNVAGCERGPR